MEANEIVEMTAAAMSTTAEVDYANRLDTSVNSLPSHSPVKRTLVGIAGRTANLGSIIGRIDQKPVITLDMATLNAHTGIWPCAIPIPEGQQLTFAGKSTSGTAGGTLVLFVNREG